MGGGPLNVRGGGRGEIQVNWVLNWGGRQDFLTIPLDHIVEVKGTNQETDLEIRGLGGGGEGLPKKFFWPFGPQFGLQIKGGCLGPSPGSPNANASCWIAVVLPS